MKYKNYSSVAILMATFNGSKFIAEQIDSIINQTFKDWTLFIRDDNSHDDTMIIIEKYIDKFSDKIVLLKDEDGTLGAKDNFMRLLKDIDSNYYMFSDQDDVWLPEKVMLSYNKYMEVAMLHPNLPIIIHSDSIIVDEQLNIITKSFWNNEGLFPSLFSFYNYVSISCLQGATMFFNNNVKLLINKYVNIPIMHDWWITTETLKNGGIVVPIKQPLLYYRQHNSNVHGVVLTKGSIIRSKFSNLNSKIQNNISFAKVLKAAGYGCTIKYYFYKTITVCLCIFKKLIIK